MKIVFILLIIPFFSVGQTVHTRDENIVYEGKQEVVGVSASEVYKRIQKTLPVVISDYKIVNQSGNIIVARGELKLKTPFNIIRRVPYTIELRAIHNGYEYLVDSVSFIEKRRGEKAVLKTSNEVLENMGEAGAVVGETEKILNETDMRFQKLLDLLKSAISADRDLQNGK